MMRKLLISTLLLLTQPVFGASFEECPAEAFLTQGRPAQLYGIDLASGAYQVLASDMGTSEKLNAIAFNVHDNYIYAWDYAAHTVARIGQDYQIEPLAVTNRPNSDFYVGDISTRDNAYYLYRPGNQAQHGLWRISLDAGDASYLDAVRIIDGSSLVLAIYDFAFSPIDDQLYSLDANGRLVRIDPATGAWSQLGDTGVTGTFGAIYFDAEGNLYASRSNDGKIFRVNPADANPTAVEVAQGPSSSNIDGARCAFAPVTISETVSLDFGDAPDSYATTLASNGARHGTGVEPLHLGALVDCEVQAAVAPLRDDDVGVDDEDGVSFITALDAGTQAIIQVVATGSGFLNGWIDFNGDGHFGITDQVFIDVPMTDEQLNLIIDIPQTAVTGASWARFRFSSQAGLGASGAVADGEVEDYPVTLTEGILSSTHYPSVHGFVTLAFEDLWPSVGDYDLNDLVVHYRTTIKKAGSSVIAVSISGEIVATGANFHNGFGVEIPGISRDSIEEASIEFTINGIAQPASPLEAGQSNAVFIVTDDIWDHVTQAEGCAFYRTENDCGDSPIQASFTITATLRTPVDDSQLTDQLFNPFIFATNGYMRSSIFSEPPGRGLEIHLKNHAPTDLADPALLGRADDTSNAGAGLYYLTQQGLPWALEIGTQWQHPSEFQDLVQAYPEFSEWVQSQGSLNADWYLPERANTTKLYKNGN